MLGRVFGALDSAAIAGMAIGAAIMPVMIATIGLRTAAQTVCTRLEVRAIEWSTPEDTIDPQL